MLVKAESAAAHPSKNNCFALNVKQDLELFGRQIKIYETVKLCSKSGKILAFESGNII